MLSLKFDGREDRILESSDSIKVESGSKLRVSVPENSSYQVLISDDQTDVILQVTNPDGSTYDVVLEGLASLYQSGDIVTQLLLDIEGEEMVVSNMTELFEALDATAAGEMDVQNRSFVDDNANIDPNRSAALDSDQDRTDLEFTPLVVYGDGEPEPVVLNNVFVQLVTDSFAYEENGASLTHDIKLVNEAGVAVNLPIGETITFALTYTSIAGIDNVEDADFITKQIEVTITGDGTDEYNFSNIVADDFLNEGLEGYSVSIDAITGDSGYFDSVSIDVLHNDAEGIIADEEVGDKVLVQLFTNDSVIESDGGTLTHSFELVDELGNSVNLPIGETITLTMSYSDISGIDGVENEDFSNKQITYTIIGDGGSSYSFDNTIVDDSIVENKEGYSISISSIDSDSRYFENVSIDTSNNGANATIIDDDSSKVSISQLVAETTTGEIDSEVDEDASHTYTLTLTNPSETDTVVTVVVGKVDTEDGEVTPVTQDVTILAGDVIKTFTVSNEHDLIVEGDEDYSVTITSTNGSLVTIDDTAKSVTTTIIDDDNAPEIDDDEFDIVENSAFGAYVGTVGADDSDGDTLTYSLETNPDNKFYIDSTSGEITYIGNDLNFEELDPIVDDITVVGDKKFYNLNIGVSDGINTTYKDFTVEILDVGESITGGGVVIGHGDSTNDADDWHNANIPSGPHVEYAVLDNVTVVSGDTITINVEIKDSNDALQNVKIFSGDTMLAESSTAIYDPETNLWNVDFLYTNNESTDLDIDKVQIEATNNNCKFISYTFSEPVYDDQILSLNEIDTDGDNIDMAQLLDDISNDANAVTEMSVDEIDLTTGDHILSNLSIADFIAMTDIDNTLEITGDSGDRVELDSTQWEVASNDAIVTNNGVDIDVDMDADGFVTYTNSVAVGGAAELTLQLLIDESIDVDLVP